jgi:hypothetical protein
MFHSINGLFFGRLQDGSVRIVKNDGSLFPDEMGAKNELDVTVPADIWASVIASVSAGGEEDYRWYLAKDFHESTGRAKLVEVDIGAPL